MVLAADFHLTASRGEVLTIDEGVVVCANEQAPDKVKNESTGTEFVILFTVLIILKRFELTE